MLRWRQFIGMDRWPSAILRPSSIFGTWSVSAPFRRRMVRRTRLFRRHYISAELIRPGGRGDWRAPLIH